MSYQSSYRQDREAEQAMANHFKRVYQATQKDHSTRLWATILPSEAAYLLADQYGIMRAPASIQRKLPWLLALGADAHGGRTTMFYNGETTEQTPEQFDLRARFAQFLEPEPLAHLRLTQAIVELNDDDVRILEDEQGTCYGLRRRVLAGLADYLDLRDTLLYHLMPNGCIRVSDHRGTVWALLMPITEVQGGPHTLDPLRGQTFPKPAPETVTAETAEAEPAPTA